MNIFQLDSHLHAIWGTKCSVFCKYSHTGSALKALDVLVGCLIAIEDFREGVSFGLVQVQLEHDLQPSHLAPYLASEADFDLQAPLLLTRSQHVLVLCTTILIHPSSR